MTKPNPNDGFPCDELLASQCLDSVLPCFTDVPERRLLVAVLVDAVRCLGLGGRQRIEVLAWIRGDYATARIPFQSLCEGLDFEAAPLARRLLLPTSADTRTHRRVGVRRMCDGGMRIVVVERHARRLARVLPLDPPALRISA